MSQYSVIAARFEHELSQLDKVMAAATSQVEKAKQTGDRDFIQAAALSLQNYYMGAERIFEEVAKRLDQSLPTGPSSHQDLLEQMGLNLDQIRPPLLSAETLSCLNRYRTFRHVVIHRYGFELYPERVEELAVQLTECHQKLVTDVREFCQFLHQLGRSLG